MKNNQLNHSIAAWISLVIFVAIALFFDVTVSSAQAIISKLPADGTWAKYRVSGINRVKPNRVLTSAGLKTIRSVGVVAKDMETYRWIEIESKVHFNDQKVTITEKFLIRERDVESGKLKDDSVLKHYQLMEQDEFKKVLTMDVGTIQSRNNVAKFFEPILDAKPKIVSKEIQTIFGTEICNGKIGTRMFDFANGPRLPIEYLVYNHKQSPFGPVFYSQVCANEDDEKDNMSFQWKMELVEIGSDAQSVLPDKK